MKKVSIRSTVIIILIVTFLSGCSGKTAGNYYKEGLKYFNSANYEEAEKNLAKALELNPDRAEYYIDYGMTLIMLNKSEEALTYFDQAILDKDNTIVNKNNKLAYRGKGIAYTKSFQYTQATLQFDKALAIDELSNLNMDILYYKGDALEKAGLYEKATETYTAILIENSSDDNIYNSRANAYRKLGDYKNSLADYDKAISLNNVNYDYYIGKYFALNESADEEGAAAVLELAANITPKTEDDKFNLAKVHYYMEDYDDASTELTEALTKGFTAAYIYLGDIYEKKGDYESAVYNYQLFIDDETTLKTATVYNQIGVCLIKLGKYEEALSYIQTGLEYNDISTEQKLKQNEIAAYESLSKYEEAYQHMTEYLTLYPEDETATNEYEFIKTRLPDASTIINTD